MYVQTALASGRKTVPTSEEYHVHMDARGGARAYIHMCVYSVTLYNIIHDHCTCTRVHVHVSRRANASRPRISSRASPRLIDCASACMHVFVEISHEETQNRPMLATHRHRFWPFVLRAGGVAGACMGPHGKRRSAKMEILSFIFAS